MPKVFIIDDEKMVITMLSEYLAKYDIVCQSAQNSIDILPKIRKFTPDIIICDLNIQPGDGISILKSVKLDAQLKNIPFIFISALEDEETIIEGLAAGASGYISKSLDLSEFKQKLMRIIDKKLKEPTDDDHNDH
jgi:DNA-binding response OmpR family regulator